MGQRWKRAPEKGCQCIHNFQAEFERNWNYKTAITLCLYVFQDIMTYRAMNKRYKCPAIGSSFDKTMDKTCSDVLTSLIVVKLGKQLTPVEYQARFCLLELRPWLLWSTKLMTQESYNQTLLSFDRVWIRHLIDVTTGYCMIRRVGYPGNDLYGRCLDEE